MQVTRVDDPRRPCTRNVAAATHPGDSAGQPQSITPNAVEVGAGGLVSVHLSGAAADNLYRLSFFAEEEGAPEDSNGPVYVVGLMATDSTGGSLYGTRCGIFAFLEGRS